MYPLSSIKQIEFLSRRISPYRFYTQRKGNVCFWSLKVLLSGIQVLIDGFNVFVFQNPLINLLPYVNEKKGEEEEVEMKLGFDLQCVPFPSRWNILIVDKSNICFCLFFVISRERKKTKTCTNLPKRFLCWLQIRRSPSEWEKEKLRKSIFAIYNSLRSRWKEEEINIWWIWGNL
jgi:hypothetical protein